MKRNLPTVLACGGLTLALLSGCMPKNAGESTSSNSGKKMGRPSVAGAGGAAAPAGAGGGDGGSAIQNESPPADNTQVRVVGGVERRLPSVAGAGGGTMRVSAPSNNSGGGGGGGSNNGLFPPSDGGGSTSLAVTGFGALFPPGDSSSASSGGATETSPSNPGRPSVAGAGGAARPGSSGNNAATASEPAAQAVTLLDKAKKHFEEGRENEGVTALYAHMLLDPDAFQTYPLQYFEQLQSPRVFLRWGVGVSYSAVKDYTGSMPPVIGDEVETASRNNRQPEDQLQSAGTGGAGTATAGDANKSKYGKVDTKTPAGALMYYTGDYAERLYRRLNDRRTGGGGYFGKLLAEMPERKPLQETAAAAAPKLSEAIPVHLRNRPSIAGAGGATAGAAPAAGAAGGAGGPAGAASGPAAIPLVQRWSGTNTADEPDSDAFGSLMPGVLFIGSGNKDTLISNAQKLGLDALIVFDVKVNKSGRQHFSSTVLRVFDPKLGDDTLAQGKALRNTDVMEKRSKGNEKNDPLELELDKVFRDFVDTNLKGKSMPAWDAAAANAHVDKLLEKIEPATKLRSAVEVMGLYRSNLIDSAKAKEALDQLLDGGGQVLLFGKDSDRQNFIDALTSEGIPSDANLIR